MLRHFFARVVALPNIARRMNNVERPTEADWKVVKVFTVLQKVAESSRLMEDEQYVSLSIGYPILAELLSACSTTNTDKGAVLPFKHHQHFLRKFGGFASINQNFVVAYLYDRIVFGLPIQAVTVSERRARILVQVWR